MPTSTRTPGRRALAALFAALVLGACAGNQPSTGPDSARPASPAGSGGINAPATRASPYVILISFDGFRADYLDRFELPHFRKVIQLGVRAKGLIPVFPSLTFPNHYSLVTGLYPEHHGIVGNSFFDPARNASYALSNRKAVADASWYRGEPIWVTAERQRMVAATFFWPGSEAAIGGVRPTYWQPFDAGVSNDARVRGVLDWLRLPDDRRPHVVLMYFNELDSVSHRHPLESPEIERAAQSVDRALGLLMDGVAALPFADRVYFVLTSDHGMTNTGASQRIRIDALLEPGALRMAYGGPVALLYVNGGPERAGAIRDTLNSRIQHGRAYVRSELPERYHFRGDPRAGDIIVVMDEGWTAEASPALPRLTRRWGMHGWDPALRSMHAIFVVSGPAIPAAVTIPHVENVDVYPFLIELLGLEPAAGIDGRPGIIREMTRTKSSGPSKKLVACRLAIDN
jgi:predicted AlkP superfamily pyrophosphatase or phosphodiesterase